MENEKRYLTVQEVAERWELKESTVRDLAEADIIPGTRVGRRRWQFLRTMIDRLGNGKPDSPIERFNRENTTAIFIYWKTTASLGKRDALWDEIRSLLDKKQYEKFILDHDVRHSDPERSQRNHGIINTVPSTKGKRFRED